MTNVTVSVVFELTARTEPVKCKIEIENIKHTYKMYA